jgi:hypothetical protein
MKMLLEFYFPAQPSGISADIFNKFGEHFGTLGHVTQVLAFDHKHEQIINRKTKEQAGAELCQAQVKLGLVKIDL